MTTKSYAPRPKSRLYRSGDPLSFRDRLEQLWAREPSITVDEAMRLTGASRSVTSTVRKRLVVSGKLARTHRDKERVW